MWVEFRVQAAWAIAVALLLSYHITSYMVLGKTKKGYGEHE